MIPWLLLAALAALAILIAALMAIIAVGHQTEERPGTIDLTGIKPRAGYEWPSASRVRAEAAPVVFGSESREAREVQAMFGQIPLDGHGDPAIDYRRPAPINALQRADGCICPDRDTRLGNCPVHSAFPWKVTKPGRPAA